jgi:hypothetical protein
MAKYQLKWREMEAEQFKRGEAKQPPGLCVCANGGSEYPGRPHVHTSDHGSHAVQDGDWIIDMGNGFFIAVKPDRFEAEYEAVPEDEKAAEDRPAAGPVAE